MACDKYWFYEYNDLLLRYSGCGVLFHFYIHIYIGTGRAGKSLGIISRMRDTQNQFVWGKSQSSKNIHLKSFVKEWITYSPSVRRGLVHGPQGSYAAG